MERELELVVVLALTTVNWEKANIPASMMDNILCFTNDLLKDETGDKTKKQKQKKQKPKKQ